MLAQRLIVAAIGIPLLALLIWAPEGYYAAAVALILAAAAFEMMRALVPDRPLALPASAGAVTALYVALATESTPVTLWSFLALAVVALVLILRPDARLANSLGGWWITACLYVGVFGAHLVLLRQEPEGQRWLVVLLAATFATDTAAYAVGRLLGRRPFMPRVSPKKTWEGAIGGVLIGSAAAVGAAEALDLRLEGVVPWAWFLLLPVAAIAGDLLESALKRKMEVKDMSGLLPGHGGLLDRLDSILLVGACLYWMVRWLQV